MNALASAVRRLRSNASTGWIGPIGVDLAMESLHLVQLELASGHLPQLRAKASLPFDTSRRETMTEPNLLRPLLKRALRKADFHGRKAVIAVPSDMFRTLSINFRCSAGKDQEAAAVLKVMKDRLDGNISDFVIDYLPVYSRTKSDERLALVAVSEREPIVSLLENARKSGLEALALEIGPVAISRLVAALVADNEGSNVLVVNSGRRASYLTLLSGSDLLFDQEVDFGENGLVRQVAETLDMPADMASALILRTGVRSGSGDDRVSAAIAEAGIVDTLSEILKPSFLTLVEEIKRVCLYAAAETRGGAVASVYLLGSIARWPGSDRLLSAMTGVQVTKFPDPLTSIQRASGTQAVNGDNLAPELAVATGLALRGMPSHG